MRLPYVCVAVVGLLLTISPGSALAGPWYEQAVLEYVPQTSPAGTFGDLNFGDGKSISIYGDRIAVGSPNAELYDGIGYVYLYSRSLAGQWSQTLSINEGADRPHFGRSVALSEDYLAVGDGFHTTAIEGRVTMYRLNDDTTDHIKMFLPGGGVVPHNGDYGTSVDLAGATLVSGYFERNGALIYEQEVLWEDPLIEQWPATRYLQGEGNTRGGRFGTVVATNGGAVAIANKPRPGASNLSGSVYLSELTSNGQWSELVELTAPAPLDNDHYGRSLSMDGNYLVVGAYGHGPRGNNTGAVYIYERSAAGEWGLVADLVPSDPGQLSFGASVAISGDHVIVGATSSAYIYERDNTGNWVEIQKFDNPTVGDTVFGREVDIDGDTAIVLANQQLYVYTVPEPSTSVILLGGALVSALNLWRRQPAGGISRSTRHLRYS